MVRAKFIFIISLLFVYNLGSINISIFSILFITSYVYINKHLFFCSTKFVIFETSSIEVCITLYFILQNTFYFCIFSKNTFFGGFKFALFEVSESFMILSRKYFEKPPGRKFLKYRKRKSCFY